MAVLVGHWMLCFNNGIKRGFTGIFDPNAKIESTVIELLPSKLVRVLGQDTVEDSHNTLS